MIVDQALGRVVATLDELGIADNTLVIYVSDHGDLATSHNGLMNKDAIMLEETMRIPLALRWPRGFEGGRTSQALVSNLDLFSTVLDVAQSSTPPDDVDSRSLLPLCHDPELPGEPVLMSECYGEIGLNIFQRMIRWSKYKHIAHLDDTDELYDLSIDPYELVNRIDETEYAPVLKEMRGLLAKRMEDSRDCSGDAKRLRDQI